MKMTSLLASIHHKLFCNKRVLLFYTYSIMSYALIKNPLSKEEKMNGWFKLSISFFLIQI